MIGRTVGKYRIVGQLGRGGAGIVYRAVDETLNRDVAIKTLNPGLADTEIMKRFRAEATILAKLNHPQIATIFELYRSETDLLMVMEFVRGETLDHLVDRLGPLSAQQAVYLVDQILSALEHAHRGGVVHRDMKPANVMVTAGAGIKIMDFGIARVRGAEQMTIDGRLMGTPAYMPPEQVLGQEVDGRADLYSVGVVLYRLLTGVLPFQSDSAIGMLQRQILEMPMSLRAHRPDVPEWADTIVQRALAKSPADRFQTAEEFREALSAAIGPLATADVAKTIVVQEPAVDEDSAHATVTDTLVMPPIDPTTVTTARRVPLTWMVGAAAAVAVVAALIGMAFRPDSSEATVVQEPPRPALATAPAATPVDMPPPSVTDPTPAVATTAVEEPPPAPRPRTTAPAPPVASRRTPAKEPVAEVETPEPVVTPEARLVFETKAVVRIKGKYKERDAYLALANGMITVTADDGVREQLATFPYKSVVEITYSNGRDPLWNSPQGPAPVARVGGVMGRMGISFGREWISLRTTTSHQFVALRFDDILVKRAILALEERTGRTTLYLERKDDKDEKSEKDARSEKDGKGEN